jgi:tetratricopeptide (TPR) repeat protein
MEFDPHLLELLGPELAALSRMMPVLRAVSSVSPEQSGAEPELERFRVFEAVAALIASAASRCPALLILDDLHWADRSTLMLLRHLIRATVDCSLLMLGTFRDPHEDIDAPFREFVDELWHEGLLEQLNLDGLARGHTAELVRGHLPDATDELIARLYERTDGNPFYVEETLRGLKPESGEALGRPAVDLSFAVPERVKRMIEWRVERLDTPAPVLLKAACVLGPTFELARSSSIAGVSSDQALQAFEAAHRAGLILADPERPDRYAFRHALVREALYDSIPPGARARLHLAAGREIERSGGGNAQPAELAMHFSHAIFIGGAEDAVRWRLAAAAEATLRHAHEEAVEHHHRALEALDATTPDDRLRAAIMLGEGQALIRAGDVESGRRRLFEAAALARCLGAADILAECALDSGSFYLSAGDLDHDLVTLLEEALEGLQAPVDRARRSRVTARLSVALYWDPPSRSRSKRLAEDAMRLALADGDALAVAWAMGSGHCANWVSERPAALLADAERTVELAQEARDEELELIARTWRVNHLLSLGRIGEVDEEIDRFVAIAERLKQSRYGWYAPLFLALRSMMAGNLGEAERDVMTLAERGGRVPGSPAPLLAAAQLFFLRSLQGRLDELEAAVGAFVETYPRIAAWRCGMAFLESQLGRHDRARSLLDELAIDKFAHIPHDNLWLLSLTMLGDTCAVSAGGHAAELERRLKPCAGVFVVSPTAAWLGPVDRTLGLLAAVQGRLDEAVTCLERATELCEPTRAASILTLVRLDHSETLLARGGRGDAERARALARAALSAAEAAGMRGATQRALAILSDPTATLVTATPAMGGTVVTG